jgi:type I restriction enzyme S subunit
MSNNNKNKLVPRLRFPEFIKQSDWDKKALKNVSEVIMGSSPSSKSYNENKIGLPLLQGNADIKNRLSAPRIYTSEVTKECQINDILLSVRAPVGTVAKSLHKACIGRGIAAIRAIDKNSQEYLYQWLISKESAWHNISQGGTFDAVNSDDVRNLLLPIPLPQEQQRIAACLSSLDEVIAGEGQKLELLKQHKKGLLQNLFPHPSTSSGGSTVAEPVEANVPRLRFKEFGDSGEWVPEILKNVFTILQGFAFSSNESVNDGVRWLKIADVGIQQMNHLSPSFLPYEFKEKYKNFLVKEGDYVIALTRPILNKKLKISKVDITLHDSLLNQRVGKLISNKCIDFVYYLLQTSNLISSIEQNIAGSEPPNLSAQQIENIEVFIPPTKQEQQRIAACLSSLDDLINAQSQKIEALKEHKKGLLQGLFPQM